MLNWSILCNTLSNNQIRKNLEALFIGIMKPSLIEQTNFDRLSFSRSGITWCFINSINTIPNSIYCIKLLFLLIYDVKRCKIVIAKLALIMKWYLEKPLLKKLYSLTYLVLSKVSKLHYYVVSLTESVFLDTILKLFLCRSIIHESSNGTRSNAEPYSVWIIGIGSIMGRRSGRF